MHHILGLKSYLGLTDEDALYFYMATAKPKTTVHRTPKEQIVFEVLFPVNIHSIAGNASVFLRFLGFRCVFMKLSCLLTASWGC